MTPFKTVLLLCLLLANSYCTKDKASLYTSCSNCPQCLIAKLEKEPVRYPPATLYKLTVNGDVYYFTPAYCCDAPSDLYDNSCKRICSPDGGFSGGGDGRCPFTFNFDSIPKQLIWTDSRR